MRTGGRLLAVVALLWLASCGSRPPAPVEDHSRPGQSGGPPDYLVTRGDTLYSIAFRYGLDYRRLAAANSISEPFTIYAGQTLVLAEREPPAQPQKSRTPAAPAAAPGPAPSASSAPVASKAPPPSVERSAPAVSQRSAPPNRAVSAWRWPNDGRVVRRFDNELHKGLDLAGTRGDPILATAAGRVVYAGQQLAGPVEDRLSACKPSNKSALAANLMTKNRRCQDPRG